MLTYILCVLGNAHDAESKQQNQGGSKKPFSEGIGYDKERVCCVPTLTSFLRFSPPTPGGLISSR
jgi:hypothetical protein